MTLDNFTILMVTLTIINLPLIAWKIKDQPTKDILNGVDYGKAHNRHDFWRGYAIIILVVTCIFIGISTLSALIIQSDRNTCEHFAHAIGREYQFTVKDSFTTFCLIQTGEGWVESDKILWNEER